MDNPDNDPMIEPLSDRERDILLLIADGLSNREIAGALFLSLETVKWYNKQIYAKLGVGSRTQAVARAHKLSLLDEPPAEPSSAVSGPSHNLPVQITSFIGRERQIEEVRALLQETRLLTLTGPGGTGKTRLAVQAAVGLVDDFPDGMAFADLSPIRRADLALGAVAGVVGVQESTDEPLLDTLKGRLADKNMLLVLDNFEQVIEAAPLTIDLVTACPGLRVLVTSREALKVYGEQEYPVPPLALPDPDQPLGPAQLAGYESIALFEQRAQASQPAFRITPDNAQAVAEICARLDGLPLAIELAAARIKLFNPHKLAEQLADRFTILRSDRRDIPDRQQTLHKAIEWSYHLLSEAEALLFTRLAVFEGGCTVEAVEAVAAYDLALDVLDGLESLLGKSLLRLDDRGDEPRFVMLETIHGYACERLGASGESDDLRTRHAGYFAGLAERAEPHTWGGPEQVRWLRRLEAEHENLRAALDWSFQGGDLRTGQRLAGALGDFWFRQGHYAEGQRWAAYALSTNPASPLLRAKILHAEARMAFAVHDTKRGRQLDLEAVDLVRGTGDRRYLGWGLILLSGHSFGQPEEFEEAVAFAEEGIALLEEVNDRAGVAQGYNVLGELFRLVGDMERAADAYNRCLALAREIGDRLREMMQIGNLAFIHQQRGEAELARDLMCQAMGLSLEINLTHHILTGIAMMAGPLVALGQAERAARLIGAAEKLFDEYGEVPQVGDVPVFEENEAAARQQLGDEAFEALAAEGRAMTLQEAVDYAQAAT
jgi:predicted ATPase/DNA-binding CsgD family transcriptional regulator